MKERLQLFVFGKEVFNLGKNISKNLNCNTCRFFQPKRALKFENKIDKNCTGLIIISHFGKNQLHNNLKIFKKLFLKFQSKFSKIIFLKPFCRNSKIIDQYFLKIKELYRDSDLYLDHKNSTHWITNQTFLSKYSKIVSQAVLKEITLFLN